MTNHDTRTAHTLDPRQANELVTKLYQAVDTREARCLEPFLSPSVTFQLGNNPPVSGKEAVLEINASFFTSIAAMAHTIDRVWLQGAHIICNGSVRYTRRDGSQLSIPFATILTTEGGIIEDYMVYADVSPLWEGHRNHRPCTQDPLQQSNPMTDHNNHVEQMLNDKSFHIEFHGYLSNHAKHAVIALNGLGAPAEDIAAYVEEYARTTYGFGLEPPKQSDIELTEANWRDFLGKHEQFDSLYRFFEGRVEDLGLEQTLKVYVPELLPGCVGALLHGTIHLGWALDAGHRGMTIEGLAYLAFSYVSCYPDRAFSESKSPSVDRTPLDSMKRIAAEWDRDRRVLSSWVDDALNSPELSVAAGFQPVLEHTGAQLHIARVLAEGHPLIHSTPFWLESADPEEVWEQLYYAVMLLYLSNPGDFVLLHLVTSLHAVEQIARHLPRDEQSRAIKCYWTAMLGVLFALKAVPTKASIVALHARYAESLDAPEGTSVTENWMRTTERALQEREEHNPKLVYVLRRLWARFGHRSVYRIAAGHFTETPVIAPDPVQSTGN